MHPASSVYWLKARYDILSTADTSSILDTDDSTQIHLAPISKELFFDISC